MNGLAGRARSQPQISRFPSPAAVSLDMFSADVDLVCRLYDGAAASQFSSPISSRRAPVHIARPLAPPCGLRTPCWLHPRCALYYPAVYPRPLFPAEQQALVTRAGPFPGAVRPDARGASTEISFRWYQFVCRSTFSVFCQPRPRCRQRTPPSSLFGAAFSAPY